MDTFGAVVYFIQHFGTYFSVFLYFKCFIDVVVMLIRHIQINKTTCASLGCGRTFLNASQNIFLMSLLLAMYDPRAPTLSVVEKKKKPLCNEEELNEITEDAKKREDHLFPVKSPAQFNQAITSISPIYLCSDSFSRPQYTQSFLLTTIVFSLLSSRGRCPTPHVFWFGPLHLPCRHLPLSCFFPFNNTL